jgi:hypothetical protein
VTYVLDVKERLHAPWSCLVGRDLRAWLRVAVDRQREADFFWTLLGLSRRLGATGSRFSCGAVAARSPSYA